MKKEFSEQVRFSVFAEQCSVWKHSQGSEKSCSEETSVSSCPKFIQPQKHLQLNTSLPPAGLAAVLCGPWDSVWANVSALQRVWFWLSS